MAPGLIATAMSAGAFPQETIRQLVPLQRAGYLTGQTIPINGGML